MIIAVHNTRGGVGTTTIAAHLCKLIQALNITVDAMSVDPTQELQRWLKPLGVPLIEPDRLSPQARQGDETFAEVLVIDVHTSQVSPVLPDLWIVPISDRLAYEHAVQLSDALSGDVVWLPMKGRALDHADMPGYLKNAITIAPQVPFSRAIRAADENGRLVWDDPDLADTAGALALRRSLRQVLDTAGLTSADPALQLVPVAAGALRAPQRHQPAQAQL